MYKTKFIFNLSAQSSSMASRLIDQGLSRFLTTSESLFISVLSSFSNYFQHLFAASKPNSRLSILKWSGEFHFQVVSRNGLSIRFLSEFFPVISSLLFVLFSIAFLRAASLAFLQPNIWRVDVNSQTAPLYSSLFEPFFSFDGQ